MYLIIMNTILTKHLRCVLPVSKGAGDLIGGMELKGRQRTSDATSVAGVRIGSGNRLPANQVIRLLACHLTLIKIII